MLSVFFYHTTAQVVASVELVLILLQGVLAYHRGWFSPKQMRETLAREQKPFEGLPWAAHLCMWLNVTLTSILSMIVHKYEVLWSQGIIAWAVLFGGVTSVLLSWSYTKTDFPEAHVQNHALTAIGLLNTLFMMGAIPIIVLFFFTYLTQDVAREDLILVSGFLAVYVFCATHLPLKFFGPTWFTLKPLKNPMTWVLLAVSTGFLTLALWTYASI